MKKGLAISGAVLLTAACAFLLYILFWQDNHRYYMRDRARAQIAMLDGCVRLFVEDTKKPPISLSILAISDPAQGWTGPCVQKEGLIDPWGVPFYYRAAREESSYILFTLGADKRIGGRGNATDIQIGSIADGS